MTQQNIAITGATNGFIGSHLCRELQSRGFKIYKVPHDMLYEREILKKTLKAIHPVYIFHCASYGNHSNQIYIDDTIKANILATYYLLEASTDIPYSAFVNISSSSVYGRKHYPMKETDLLEPETFYAASKAGAEYLCRAFAKKFHKPIVNIRPASIYGEGEADFRFIPSLIHALVTGTEYVLSEGEHDWTYVTDLVDGIFHIVDTSIYPECDLSLKGQVYNIGTGKSQSNYQIYIMLAKIAGKTIDLKTTPVKDADSPIWKVDSSKLQAMGWKPRVSLEEGLQRTYEYYAKKYQK